MQVQAPSTGIGAQRDAETEPYAAAMNIDILSGDAALPTATAGPEFPPVTLTPPALMGRDHPDRRSGWQPLLRRLSNHEHPPGPEEWQQLLHVWTEKRIKNPCLRGQIKDVLEANADRLYGQDATARTRRKAVARIICAQTNAMARIAPMITAAVKDDSVAEFLVSDLGTSEAGQLIDAMQARRLLTQDVAILIAEQVRPLLAHGVFTAQEILGQIRENVSLPHLEDLAALLRTRPDVDLSWIPSTALRSAYVMPSTALQTVENAAQQQPWLAQRLQTAVARGCTQSVLERLATASTRGWQDIDFEIAGHLYVGKGPEDSRQTAPLLNEQKTTGWHAEGRNILFGGTTGGGIVAAHWRRSKWSAPSVGKHCQRVPNPMTDFYPTKNSFAVCRLEEFQKQVSAAAETARCVPSGIPAKIPTTAPFAVIRQEIEAATGIVTSSEIGVCSEIEIIRGVNGTVFHAVPL